jgi:hypothetical protein
MVITICIARVMYIKFNSQITYIKVYLYFQASWPLKPVKLKRITNCVCKVGQFIEHPKMLQGHRTDLKAHT